MSPETGTAFTAEPAAASVQDAPPGLGPYQLAWRRLRRNKIALAFGGLCSVMKVAIEPVHPAMLPRMLDGLRALSRLYPLLTARVEESGEHVLVGTGELYLDCALHDLRTNHSAGRAGAEGEDEDGSGSGGALLDLRVSDVAVLLRETVLGTSFCKARAADAGRVRDCAAAAYLSNGTMSSGLAPNLMQRSTTKL